jgi:hypothetical protein
MDPQSLAFPALREDQGVEAAWSLPAGCSRMASRELRLHREASLACVACWSHQASLPRLGGSSGVSNACYHARRNLRHTLSEPPRQRVDNVDSTRSSSQQLDERPENASIENEGLVVTVMDTAHQKGSEARRFGYPRLSDFS